MMRKDKERKAMFANMFSNKKKDRLSKKDINLLVNDLLVDTNVENISENVKDENRTTLENMNVKFGGIQNPPGLQYGFLSEDFATGLRNLGRRDAKKFAEEYVEANPEDGEYTNFVVPLYKEGKVVGYGVSSAIIKSSYPRVYKPSPPESDIFANFPKEDVIEEVGVRGFLEKPFYETTEDFEKSNLKKDSISKIIEDEVELKQHRNYISDLLFKFEQSGEEDFDKFRAKYNIANKIKGYFGDDISYKEETPGRFKEAVWDEEI